jgi:hypothetical protein
MAGLYAIFILLSLVCFAWAVLAVFDRDAIWDLRKKWFQRPGYVLPDHLRGKFWESQTKLAGLIILALSPICFFVSIISFLSEFEFGVFLLGIVLIIFGVVIAAARDFTWRRFAMNKSWLDKNRRSSTWNFYSLLVGGLVVMSGLLIFLFGLV